MKNLNENLIIFFSTKQKIISTTSIDTNATTTITTITATTTTAIEKNRF